MLAQYLKLLHILLAIWMTTGIIGRFVGMWMAEHSQDLEQVFSLMLVTDVFERKMVIPGSSAVVLAGIFTTFAQGWPLFGFLQHGASNWVFVSLVLFLTIIPIIIFIFLPRGKVFQAALDRAAVEKAVTAELKAAFRDPVVRAAHYYELGVIVVIIWLMVVKPF